MSKIDTLKARHRAAESALSKVYERQRAEREAMTRRQQPKLWAAAKKVREARQAVKVAELAALGITPMQTIVLWHPKYTGVTAMNRYCVRVTVEGYSRLVPVGKKGAILQGRVEQSGPYDLTRLVVTDETLKERAP